MTIKQLMKRIFNPSTAPLEASMRETLAAEYDETYADFGEYIEEDKITVYHNLTALGCIPKKVDEYSNEDHTTTYKISYQSVDVQNLLDEHGIPQDDLYDKHIVFNGSDIVISDKRLKPTRLYNRLVAVVSYEWDNTTRQLRTDYPVPVEEVPFGFCLEVTIDHGKVAGYALCKLLADVPEDLYTVNSVSMNKYVLLLELSLAHDRQKTILIDGEEIDEKITTPLAPRQIISYKEDQSFVLVMQDQALSEDTIEQFIQLKPHRKVAQIDQDRQTGHEQVIAITTEFDRYSFDNMEKVNAVYDFYQFLASRGYNTPTSEVEDFLIQTENNHKTEEED